MGVADVFPFLKPYMPGDPQPSAPPLPPDPVPSAPPAPHYHEPHHPYHAEPAGTHHQYHHPPVPHHDADPYQRHVHAAAPGEPHVTPAMLHDDVPYDGTAIPAGLQGVQIATPKIEMQPWVLDFIGWFNTATYGVARVDLKRPTPPDHANYKADNIFVVTPTIPQPVRGWRSRSGRRPPGVRAELVGEGNIRVRDLDAPPTLSGARLKVSRHISFWADGPEGSRPWVDCGVGLNYDMDLQRLSPVARIKIKDFAAIKAYPTPMLKVGGEWRLFDTSLALKLHYELPLMHIRHPFTPPARILLRLDHVVNSGIKLSPSGVEFDETVMQLGQSTAVRAAGGLAFPRQLPIEGELQDAFKLQLHRLGLKTYW